MACSYSTQEASHGKLLTNFRQSAVVEEGSFGNHPDLFAGITIHLMMEATMGPNIVRTDLPVIIAVEIVTELLRFILIKIEFHSYPLPVGAAMRRKG
jgi:hypothetical protein